MVRVGIGSANTIVRGEPDRQCMTIVSIGDAKFVYCGDSPYVVLEYDNQDSDIELVYRQHRCPLTFRWVSLGSRFPISAFRLLPTCFSAVDPSNHRSYQLFVNIPRCVGLTWKSLVYCFQLIAVSKIDLGSDD